MGGGMDMFGGGGKSSYMLRLAFRQLLGSPWLVV